VGPEAGLRFEAKAGRGFPFQQKGKASHLRAWLRQSSLVMFGWGSKPKAEVPDANAALYVQISSLCALIYNSERYSLGGSHKSRA
jgi:hypothetical protein